METNTFWQLVTEPWLMQRGSKLDRASEPATRVIVGFDCSVESSWGSESNLVQRPSMLSPSLAGEQRLRAPSVNTRSIPDKRSQNRCSRNSSCNPSPVSLAEPQAEPRQSPSGGRPASDNVNIGAPSRAASSRSEPDEEMAAAVEYAKKLWGSSPAAIVPTGTIPAAAASGARFLHSSPTSASGFPASTSPASLDSRGASGSTSVGAPPKKQLCIFSELNGARTGAAAAHEELSVLRGVLQKEQQEVAALQAQVQQLAYEKEELLQQATWYAQQAYYASATAAAPPAPTVRASL